MFHFLTSVIYALCLFRASLAVQPQENHPASDVDHSETLPAVDPINSQAKRRLLSLEEEEEDTPTTEVFWEGQNDDCDEVVLLYAEKLLMTWTCSATQNYSATSKNIISVADTVEIQCATNNSRTLEFNSSAFEMVGDSDFFNCSMFASKNQSGKASNYWSVKKIDCTFSCPGGVQQDSCLSPYSFATESYTKSISGVPVGFSFHCGPPIVYEHRNTSSLDPEGCENGYKLNASLTMEGVQLQMFTNNKTFTNQVDDCAGYFSTGLWSGFLVVGLFVFILIVSLYSLFGMQTMDRFDDPKGKTIIVPTSL
eukprot:m.6412 g.6412  ORF g.6412 m.6412 type:complete len:310 (+) comp15814_c0_seq1:54-983(+)